MDVVFEKQEAMFCVTSLRELFFRGGSPCLLVHQYASGSH